VNAAKDEGAIDLRVVETYCANVATVQV